MRRFLNNLLALLGLVSVCAALGLATGYWWAKSGEKMFMQSVKADTSRIDCGSCKKLPKEQLK